MYLYYPVPKCPCYHFVIEVDNKNNSTVDNMEVLCVYYSVVDLKLQYAFRKFTRNIYKKRANLLRFREQSIII